MKKRLVLLTARFPFDKGEEFLETEVPYLAQYFDLDIIPLTRVDHSFQRPLPTNVTVHNEAHKTIVNAGNSIVQKSIWILKHQPLALIDIFALLVHELSPIFSKTKLVKKILGIALHAAIIKSVLKQSYTSKPTPIFYSYWLTYGALALAQWKKNDSSIFVISRTHRGDLYAERSPDNYLIAQEYIIQHLDKTICISEHGANYLRQRYPLIHNQIFVSRLGVAQAPSINTPSNDGRLHIVTCSYLSAVKRVSLLIEALMQCDFPVTWTHLGGGELENKLISDASQLPVSIQWKFTGLLPNQDILKFYQEHPIDIFVNVSSSEGLPVSIMEAMSYGIPVAATNVGGTSEIVHHEQNGFLWNENVTPSSIFATLSILFSLSREQKDTMRSVAWHSWHDKVNAQIQYTEFAKWLISSSNLQHFNSQK